MDQQARIEFETLDAAAKRAFAIACAMRYFDIGLPRVDVQAATAIQAAVELLDDDRGREAALTAQQEVNSLLPDDLSDLPSRDYLMVQAISVMDEALSAILAADPSSAAISAADGAIQVAAELDVYGEENAEPKVLVPGQARRMGPIESWEVEQQARTIRDLATTTPVSLVIRTAQEAAEARPPIRSWAPAN